MFDIDTALTEGGRSWMVVADAPGFGSGVIVPEREFEGLSDEEIGREVRRLMKDARLLRARVWARVINMGNGEQFGDESVVALLSEFRREDDTVAAAYFKKIEARRSALASAGRRHDREMRKKVGRGYQQAFQRVVERDGYSCSKCSKSGGGEEAVSLHLVYKEHRSSAEGANPADLELVCSECL